MKGGKDFYGILWAFKYIARIEGDPVRAVSGVLGEKLRLGGEEYCTFSTRLCYVRSLLTWLHLDLFW